MTRIEDYPLAALTALFNRYGLVMGLLPNDSDIPGSFWGAPEAGLIDRILFVRPDTPVHSALHEACHYICMDQQRRSSLHTDAGGTHQEENAVCYLQILLADELPGVGRRRLWRDMDAWGYSFRLGSSQAWFERDAEDAYFWLLSHALIDTQCNLAWRVRTNQLT